MRHIFETMREAGGGEERLVGGGTKGGLWTQIVSDVTGRAQDLHKLADMQKPGVATEI